MCIRPYSLCSGAIQMFHKSLLTPDSHKTPFPYLPSFIAILIFRSLQRYKKNGPNASLPGTATRVGEPKAQDLRTEVRPDQSGSSLAVGYCALKNGALNSGFSSSSRLPDRSASFRLRKHISQRFPIRCLVYLPIGKLIVQPPAAVMLLTTI